MTISFSEVAKQLAQKCESGRQRTARAFHQAFDAAWELELASAVALDRDNLPTQWDSSGLVFVFQAGGNAGIAILTDGSGLLPTWCAQPDAAEQDKLRFLAMELAATCLPTQNASPDCTVGRVKNVRDAMSRAATSQNSVLLPIAVRRGEQNGTLWIVWPTANANSLPLENQLVARQAETATGPANQATPRRREIPHYNDLDEGIGLLPPYSRSLLRIRVPVTVTLATTKQSLEAILNIGSGSIIHFNKSCEDTLTLEVAGHKVAVGETVKVGDKFGLWITSMILPDERFWVISNRENPVRAR